MPSPVMNASLLAGVAKEMAIFDFPFLFNNTREADAVSDSAVGQKLLDKLQEKGLIGLAYWDLGYRQVHTGKKPIAKADDFKGIKHESPAELKLELPVDAYIPATYVDSERLRLEAYHKLSAASGENATKAQLDAILAELEDRYGKAPESVLNLIKVTELRQQANRLGLKDFNVLGLQAKLQPVDLSESEQVRIASLYPGTKYLQSAQTLLIGAPRDANFEPLRDTAIIQWAWALLAKVFSNTESSENDKA